MVKAELTIELKDGKDAHIGLDLLKREDWNEDEWNVANMIQETLLTMIKMVTDSGLAELEKQEIIK